MKLKAIILICSAIVFLIGTGCDEGSGPECRLNSDCPGDELCIGGKCLMECKTDKDCLPDGECSGGYCEFPDAPKNGGEGGDSCQELFGEWEDPSSPENGALFTSSMFYQVYFPTCESDDSGPMTCSNSSIHYPNGSSYSFSISGNTLSLGTPDGSWTLKRASSPCGESNVMSCGGEGEQDCSFH